MERLLTFVVFGRFLNPRQKESLRDGGGGETLDILSGVNRMMFTRLRLIRRMVEFACVLAGACWVAGSAAVAATDPAFSRWLEALWPQAQAMGISRKTFDSATHGLEPDLTLPDLDLPGRRSESRPAQAEFVQTPADYIKEATIARLAGEGRKLLAQY